MVLVTFPGVLSKGPVQKGKDLRGKGECLLHKWESLHGSWESSVRSLQLLETLQAVIKGMCSWKEPYYPGV